MAASNGAAGFATDFRQIMGPEPRRRSVCGSRSAKACRSQRLQYETACAALQSQPCTLEPGRDGSWTFFGVFSRTIPASSDADPDPAGRRRRRAARDWAPRHAALPSRRERLLHGAPSVVADTLDDKAIAARYRRRTHVERGDGELLSFFAPGRTHSRHVVSAGQGAHRGAPARRAAAQRRGHAARRRDLLCAHRWMHGVFGAQLTIGNTSFHKLFSVSRDPYNITRASGLRMLVEIEDGWRLLTVPSASKWASTIAAGSIGSASGPIDGCRDGSR